MFVPKEVQIDELAQKIYFKEPQSPHSIQLVHLLSSILHASNALQFILGLSLLMFI